MLTHRPWTFSIFLKSFFLFTIENLLISSELSSFFRSYPFEKFAGGGVGKAGELRGGTDCFPAGDLPMNRSLNFPETAREKLVNKGKEKKKKRQQKKGKDYLLSRAAAVELREDMVESMEEKLRTRAMGRSRVWRFNGNRTAFYSRVGENCARIWLNWILFHDILDCVGQLRFLRRWRRNLWNDMFCRFDEISIYLPFLNRVFFPISTFFFPFLNSS